MGSGILSPPHKHLIVFAIAHGSAVQCGRRKQIPDWMLGNIRMTMKWFIISFGLMQFNASSRRIKKVLNRRSLAKFKINFMVMILCTLWSPLDAEKKYSQYGFITLSPPKHSICKWRNSWSFWAHLCNTSNRNSVGLKHNLLC